MNHIYRLKQNRLTLQLQPVPETARSAGKGRTATGASSLAQAAAGTVASAVASAVLAGVASLAHAQQAPPPAPAVKQLPQGGVVSRGSASIVTHAANAQMTVNQTSARAVIDWASFNVGSQAKVQFNQPSASAVVLNQVQGNNASQIFGQISANGQVILSNPNGVYFSPTSSVDVGGLVATTGKAHADEFMAGKTRLTREDSTGSVINQGQLKAALGGYIALLAPEVRNQGVVIAQAGTVALASGEAITLNFNNGGTSLAGLTTTPQAIAALVDNRSAVLAEGGQIILSAHALASLQGSVVKNSGQLSATSLSDKGGKIVLMADQIDLTGTSRIDANGAQGGGTVLVGGDWQGSGDTRQAMQVTMAPGASIEANASSQGDGGTVVLWSDVKNASSQTTMAGSISAEGRGANSTGGQVETSGAQLKVADSASVRMGGPGATGGRWLLDPTDFTIAATGGDITGAALGASITAGNTVEVLSDSGTTGTAGNINVNDAISWSNTGILKLTASGGVTGSGVITMSGASGTGLVLNQSGNSTYSGNIIGTNASVTKQGPGTLTLSGASSTYRSAIVSEGTLKLGSPTALGTGTSGTVTVSSGATLDLGGQAIVVSNAKALTVSGTGVGNAGAMVNSSATAATYPGLLTLGGATSIVASAGNIILSNVGTITGSGFNLTLGGSATGSSVASIIGTGAGGVTKQGTGTWTLSGANTYTGGTLISSGILRLGNAAALGTGTTGDVSVSAGAALDLNGQTILAANAKALTIRGAGVSNGGALMNSGAAATYPGLLSLGADASIVAGSGNITLSNTGTITGAGFNLTLVGGASTNSSIASIIGTGAGAVIKQGAGTWTLNGANTYTGGTLISAGILKLGNAATLGTGTTGDVSVSTGGALDLNGQTIVAANAKALTISGTGVSNGGAVMNSSTTAATYPGLLSLGADASIISGTTTGSITLSHAGTITGAGFNLTLGGTGSSSVASSIASIIGTGSGGVVKQDSGVWTLSGANTYTGNVTINGGTLRLGNTAALGAGTAGRVTVASGATLDLYGYSVAAANAKTLALSGTGVSNLGALTNTVQSTSSYPGLLTLAADASIAGGFRGSIVLSNTGTIAGAGFNLTLGGNNLTNNVIASIIGTGTGAVTINSGSAGTWLLLGANTYSGGTTVSTGILKAGSPTAFGTGAIVVNSVAGIGGMLDLNGQTMTSTAGLTIGGTGSYVSTGVVTNSSSTAATYPGLLTLNANATIQANNGPIILSNPGTITGAGFNLTLDFGSVTGSRIDSIIGTGAGSVTKRGKGTWILNGANTYTGGTTLTNNMGTPTGGGILKLGNPTALGTGPVVVTTGEVDLNGQTLAGNQALSIAGYGDKSGGALSNSSATPATYDGQITLTAAAGISGNIHLTNSNAISGSFALTLTGDAGGTVSSPIGTSSMIKQGAGTWTVAVPTTTTSINIYGGTLAAGVDNAFPSNASLSIDSRSNSVSVLSLGTSSLTAGGVTIQTTGGNISSTTGVLSSPVSVYADGSKFGATISAIIGGAGGLTVGMASGNPSTLILTGANTYTGTTSITNGTLRVGDGGTTGSLSPSGAVNLGSGATLAYNLSTGAAPTNAFAFNGGTMANLAYGSVLDLSGVASIITNSTIKLSPSVNETLTTPTVASIVLKANPSLSSLYTFNVITTGYQASFPAQTAISWAGTSTSTPTLQLNGLPAISGQPALGGTLTLSSSQLTIGGAGAIWAFTNNGVTRYISVANDATNTALAGTPSIVVPAGVSATQSGTLTGTVGLTITGGGTLTLSGNNSGYSGAKTVSAGLLKVGSANALGTGSTTVSFGAALDLNGQTPVSAGTLTLNGTGINGAGALMNSSGAASYGGLLTLGSGSSIIAGAGSIDLSNSGTVAGTFALTLGGAAGGSIASIIGTSSGALTKQDAGTWTLSGVNTYSGGTTISAGILKAGSASAFGSGTITVASGAALDLNGQTMANAGSLTLNGTGVSNGGALMNSSTAPASYARPVTLGSDSLVVGGSGTVALSNSSSLTGGDYALTLGGAAGGSVTSVLGVSLRSLTKQDAGTWTLRGASLDYVGGITVNAGTLEAGVATSAFGSPGNSILVNGGTLSLGTFSQTVGDVTIGANGGAITSSTGVLTGTSYTINNAGPATATVSAILAGAVPLIKTGTGLATLSGANTYVGDTRINGGTLALGSAGALSTAGTISFGGGTLQYSASNMADYSSRISTSPGQAYAVDTNGQSVTWASNLASTSASVTKSGTGTLTLGGSNNLSGGVTVNAGTLQADSASALGSGSVAVASGATLAYNVAGAAAPSNTFTGAGTIANVAYGRSLDLSGATLTGFTGAYEASVNESVSPNTVAAMVLPTGLNLASNTLSVNTVGLDSNFVDTPAITWAGSVSGTPAYRLNGNPVTSGQVVSGRSLAFNANNLTLVGAPPLWTMTINGVVSNFYVTTDTLGANLTGATTINVPAGVSVTESGVLSGAGNLTITGGGSILLSGNNSYTGTTSITNATVILGHSSALGTGSSGVTVASGSTLDLNGQNVTASKTLTLNGTGISQGGALKNSSATAASYAGLVALGSASSIIAGTGTIALTNTSATGITGAFGLTLGGAAGGTIATPIKTGTGSLTKQDAGTWTLSGANTSTGGITVSGGTLSAGANNAFGNNDIAVNGGTLALGTYSQTTGAVSIGSAGGSITSSTGVLTGTSYSIANNSPATATISANLGGTGGLTKTGTGTAILSGNNIYTGGTTIGTGANLQISADVNLGNAPFSPATNITIDGGTLTVSGQPSTLSLASTRRISMGPLGGTIHNASGSAGMIINGAITSAGPVTLSGLDLMVMGNVTVSTASPILIKSPGHITQGANSTVSSLGGPITYWSDSDGSGDGSISLNATSGSWPGAKVISNNGNIVLGGGVAGGLTPTGAARGPIGVHVQNGATVQAGSGDVSIRGTGNGLFSGAGYYGVSVLGSVSGANVTITGTGFDNTSTSSGGVQLEGATITGSGLVSITAVGGGTLNTAGNSSNNGLSMRNATVQATGTGSLLVNATGGGHGAGASNLGLHMMAGTSDASFLSDSGSITLNLLGGGAGGSSNMSLSTVLSSSTQTSNIRFASQTGNITIRAQDWSFGSSSASSPRYNLIQTAGALTLEPLTTSASFGAASLDLSYVSLSSNLSSLTLGKPGNTTRIGVGSTDNSVYQPVSSYSVAGPISIYGDIYIGKPLITTGTGSNGLVTLSGNVRQSLTGSVTTPLLLLAGTGSSLISMRSSAPNGNRVGTLAGSGLGAVTFSNASATGTPAEGALTVGTVGGVQGLSATGTVNISTYQGDLVLNESISTTSAGTSNSSISPAILLNAGKFMAVGDTNSGNIVFNGSSTITMGAGGQALLYSGSVSGSTGLAALVGSASGRFRYGSTNTGTGGAVMGFASSGVNNYTTALGTTGFYAIYRERPSVSWSTAAPQSLIYGNHPTTPAADVTSTGLVSGDALDANTTLRLVSTNAVAALNASGFYNAGNYFYSRTEGAKGLGYLVSNPTVSIGKATLTLTARNDTKAYDGLAYTGNKGYTLSGLLGADTVNTVVSSSGSVQYNTGSSFNAVNASSTPYAITPSTAAGFLTAFGNTNYTLNHVSGSLTVNPVPLKVTIYNDARFVGQQDAVGYAGAGYSGFVGGQNASVLGGSLSISRLGGDTVPGVYKNVLVGSGLVSSNYTISYIAGNYTIVPADQLLVKFSNTAATYAGTPTYAVNSAQYFKSSTNQLVDLTNRVVLNGNALTLDDGASGLTAFSVGPLLPQLSTSGKLTVGAYSLGATSITNTSSNYSNTITVTGGLQVNPLGVTAAVTSSVAKPYDGSAAMRALTMGLTGVVAGDVVVPVGSGTYTSKDSGNGHGYTVSNMSLSGADAKNYLLVDSVNRLASNTLSGSNGVITPVPLTISANNDSKTYDGNAYSGGNGVTYSGFIGNEDATVLGGALTYGGTSQGASNAGTYSIVPSGLTSTNYTIGYTDGNLVINPAGLMAITGTVVAPAGAAITKVYDGNNTATLTPANYSIVGWAAGEGATITKTTGTYDSPDAGTGKTVTVSLLASDYLATGSTVLSNYTLPTSVSGAVGVITAKPVTVTNTARTTTYDGATTYGTLAAGMRFTTSAMVGSDALDSVTQTAQGVSAAGVAQAGGFAVRPSNAVMGVGNSANYDFTYVDATHTVAKANLTVTASSITATPSASGNIYNGSAFTGTYTMNALGNDASGITVTGMATGTHAGTYTSSLQVSGAALSNYNTPVITEASLVVSPRPITVTADAKSRMYGDANPALTFTVAADGVGTSRGLVNGDSFTGSLSTAATGASNVGSYTIDASALANSNYQITANNGSLTVTQRPVTVTADAKSRMYGDANPALTFTVAADGVGTSRGLVNGDSFTGSLSTAATGASNVGSYTIDASALANSNYQITANNGSLTVMQRPVTVTNVSRSTTYDGVSSYGTLASGTQFTASNLVGPDSVASLTQTPSGAGVTPTGVAQAGSFTVTPSSAVMGTGLASNYDFSYVTSTHTVNMASLGVTISGVLQGAVSKAYDGSTVATLAPANYRLTGWLGSDGATVTKTTGTYDTASAGSGKTVTVSLSNSDYLANSGTNLANYSLPTSISGAVGQIDKANATVTANSGILTYSGASQTVSGFTASGLVGGQTAAVLTGVTASTTRKNAGTYTTTASGTDGNYNLTFVDGQMVINKANATVTANSGTLTYTGANQTVDGFTASGLVGGQTAAVLTGVTASTTRKNAGTYTTTASGTDGNYNLTFVDGQMVINKANATVTANSGTLTYTGANQTVNGFTASGLVGGETAAVLTGVTASTTRKNAGTYTTTASGTDGNYNLTFVDGSMVIQRTPLTVRANNDAKFVTQSDASGYAGVSYSGWVGGETASTAGLGGTLVVTRSSSGPDGNTTASNALAGNYTGALTPSGLSSGNYTINFVPGNYTIVPARQLLVRMAPAEGSYGSAASYSVTDAKYLNQTSNTIVDLTGNVSRSGNSFTVTDGAGGRASFTVSPLGAVSGGAGQLAAGSYQFGAGGVNVVSDNFSNNLTLVGAQSVMAAPVTATPQVSKVYDGTTAIAQQVVPLTGVAAGDTVVASGSGAFASKTAGSNLGYTISGLALSGADAGNYYMSGGGSVSANNGSITPAPLTVSFAAASKVYDGSATVHLIASDNRIGSDVLTVSATGTFADKNVGPNKTVTVSGVSLTGADAGNYSLGSTGSSPTASITRLANVAWVGGATGNWFDPANWAGGAVPDLSNVASVTIPAGVTVNFGTAVVAPAQAGAVNLDALGTAGSLNQSGGTLNVGAGGVTLHALTQSGGSLSTSGAVTLGSLSQSAGSLSAASLSTTTAYSQTGAGTVSVTGPAQISATTGPVVLGQLVVGGNLNVNSTGGAITQTAGTTVSGGGATSFSASANGQPADVLLPNSGNRFAQPVQVVGAQTMVAGINGSGNSGTGDVPGAVPAVLTPALPQNPPPYVLTVLKAPREGEGVLHLAWRRAIHDRQFVLPPEVQTWVQSAGQVQVLGPGGDPLPGVELSADGRTLGIKPAADGQVPEQIVFKAENGRIVIRVVKTP